MLHHEISGDANAQPSELLETGALWNGDPGVFLQALRDAHLVDLLGLVIDWDKRLERYTLFLLKEEKQNEKRRSAATQRKRDERKRDAEKAEDATIAILRQKDAGTARTEQVGTEQDRTEQPLEPNKNEPNKIEPSTPEPNTDRTEHARTVKNVTHKRETNQESNREIKPANAPPAIGSVVRSPEIDTCRPLKTEVGSFFQKVESPTWRAMRGSCSRWA